MKSFIPGASCSPQYQTVRVNGSGDDSEAAGASVSAAGGGSAPPPQALNSMEATNSKLNTKGNLVFMFSPCFKLNSMSLVQ
jgi:hypothetical protein